MGAHRGTYWTTLALSNHVGNKFRRHNYYIDRSAKPGYSPYSKAKTIPVRLDTLGDLSDYWYELGKLPGFGPGAYRELHRVITEAVAQRRH